MATPEVSGDVLWAWQEQEPDGSWGIIAALIPGLGGASPLVLRSHDQIVRLSALAQAHARTTGRPVRLAKFGLHETSVRLDW